MVMPPLDLMELDLKRLEILPKVSSQKGGLFLNNLTQRHALYY